MDTPLTLGHAINIAGLIRATSLAADHPAV